MIHLGFENSYRSSSAGPKGILMRAQASFTLQIPKAERIGERSQIEKLSFLNWVVVKELNLSYYIGETLLFTIYTHYGNLI